MNTRTRIARSTRAVSALLLLVLVLACGGEPVPGCRLVGVVLEGPQGSLFFMLTGPERTARAMEKDLLAMVAGAHR